MAIFPIPNPELVRQFLRYDGDTGLLFWRRRSRDHFVSDREYHRWNARYADKEAFTTHDSSGYRFGHFGRKKIKAHRAIWCLCTGEWPNGTIDHINGDRTDNRIGNLRDVKMSENMLNQKIYSNNTSGYPGVRKNEFDTWTAQISFDRKIIFLGNYNTFLEAVAARKGAQRALGFHPNHAMR